MKKSGKCKLTLKQGRFVKCHLIPKALTRPEYPGARLIQGGYGTRAKVRHDSWYDPQLVIREGEDVLEKHDTWAIDFLRKAKLVWSGWGPRTELGDLHKPIPRTEFGNRVVHVAEPERLRLFIFSLLWRAAMTSLMEFGEISLPSSDKEKLRMAVIGTYKPDLDFYPSQLIQLSTLGTTHNLAPINDVKIIPSYGGKQSRQIPIIRFYLDGLIIHIHKHSSDDGYTKSLNNIFVGVREDLHVTTVNWGSSFQAANLSRVIVETEGMPQRY